MQFLTTSSLCALLKTVLDFSTMETKKEKEIETYVRPFILKLPSLKGYYNRNIPEMVSTYQGFILYMCSY